MLRGTRSCHCPVITFTRVIVLIWASNRILFLVVQIGVAFHAVLHFGKLFKAVGSFRFSLAKTSFIFVDFIKEASDFLLPVMEAWKGLSEFHSARSHRHSAEARTVPVYVSVFCDETRGLFWRFLELNCRRFWCILFAQEDNLVFSLLFTIWHV